MALSSRREFLETGLQVATMALGLQSGCSFPNSQSVEMPSVAVDKPPSYVPQEKDPQAAPIMLRSIPTAVAAYSSDRKLTPALPPTDLEKEINNPDLSKQSKYGLGNGHFWRSEKLPFSFATPPKLQRFIDEGEEFIIFGNNPDIYKDFLPPHLVHFELKALYDRSLTMMREGISGTAIIEFATPHDPAEVQKEIKTLASLGVRNFIAGNEPDEQDDVNLIRSHYTLINDVVKNVGASSQVSWPGWAYSGNNDYEERTILNLVLPKPNPIGGFKEGSMVVLPDRFSDHYYGPVDAFGKRLSWMRQRFVNAGILRHVKYDLMEVGYPVNAPGIEHLSDAQYGEQYLPQVLTIAAASDLVDRIFVYALLDGGLFHHSLSFAENGQLKPKVTYAAFANAAKLYTGLEGIQKVRDDDLSKFEGAREEGTQIQVLWSNDNKVQTYPVPNGFKAFDAFGNFLPEETQNGVILTPRDRDFLAGGIRYLIKTVA